MSAIKADIDRRKIEQIFGRLSGRERYNRALAEIGEAVVSSIQLSFRESVDPYGVPWAPLSAVTLAKRRGSSAQILRDTGRLANSVNSFRTQGDRVVIGATPYGATHQFGAAQGQYGRTKRGGPIPWGTIPARPFFPNTRQGLPRALREEIDEIVRDAIAGD